MWLLDLKLGWTARMTDDKVRIENHFYKMEMLTITNKMLFKGEQVLCRKRNDQLYSMIWQGHKLKGNDC